MESNWSTAGAVAEIRYDLAIALGEGFFRGFGVSLTFFPELAGWNIEIDSAVPPGCYRVRSSSVAPWGATIVVWEELSPPPSWSSLLASPPPPPSSDSLPSTDGSGPSTSEDDR